MTRKVALLAIAGGCALFGGAAGGAVLKGHSKPASKPIPLAYAARQVSAPPVPASTALEQVMSRMGGGAVAAARLGAPPADAGQGTRPWLYATVRVPGMDRGLDVEPMWEADLVEGAVADLAGTAKDIHDDFGGSTFDAELPDGSAISDASGGLGDVVRGQVFSTAPDGTIEAQIVDALRSAHLNPISIRILRPLDAAPAVVASAADPTTAAKNLAAIRDALFGNPAAYEGYYLELRDASGNAFVRTSASFRTGAGRFWVEPSLADVASIKSFGRPPGDAPHNTGAQLSQK